MNFGKANLEGGKQYLQYIQPKNDYMSNAHTIHTYNNKSVRKNLEEKQARDMDKYFIKKEIYVFYKFKKVPISLF